MSEKKNDDITDKNNLSKEDCKRLEKELLRLFEEFEKLVDKNDSKKMKN